MNSSAVPIYIVGQGAATCKKTVQLPKEWSEARVMVPRQPRRKKQGSEIYAAEMLARIAFALEQGRAALYRKTETIPAGQTAVQVQKTGNSTSLLPYLPAGPSLFPRYLTSHPGPFALADLLDTSLFNLALMNKANFLLQVRADNTLTWLSWEEVKGRTRALALSFVRSRDPKQKVPPMVYPGVYVADRKGAFLNVEVTFPNALVQFPGPLVREVAADPQPEPGRINLASPIVTQRGRNVRALFGSDIARRDAPAQAHSHHLDITTCFLVFADREAIGEVRG